MVSPLSYDSARKQFPHVFTDLNGGAFENSLLSQLDRDIKPFYHTMSSDVLSLLYGILECRGNIAAHPESQIDLASSALKKTLKVLVETRHLDYKLFLIVLRQSFLLFAPLSTPTIGHISNGRELVKNRKELLPKSVIPKSLLPLVISSFIRIHLDQLYDSGKQFEHFLYLTTSYKTYGFQEFFEGFYASVTCDMSIGDYDNYLNFFLFCLNLLKKDGVEYNALKIKEAFFLREIKDNGIRKSVSFRYFLRVLSHNELDLNMLTVWLHIFSQLPESDLAYIRNESMLFIYTRFSMIEPVIFPKRWYKENDCLKAATAILLKQGIGVPGKLPRIFLDRGIFRAAKPIPETVIEEIRRLPAIREVKIAEKVKRVKAFAETNKVHAATVLLLKHKIGSLEKLPRVSLDEGILKVSRPLPEAVVKELKMLPAVHEVEVLEKVKRHTSLTETFNILRTVKYLLEGPVVDVEAMRGFIHYFHSLIPHGELTEKESKATAKLYIECFRNSGVDIEDRLYLELVYRNPFPKSLKMWVNADPDWEKEACKLVEDYLTQKFPLDVVEKNIQALYRFFLSKKEFSEQAPIILRNLYFEMQKKATTANERIMWCIKALEHGPIDENKINPFLCTLPGIFLANSKIALKTHIKFITSILKCYKLSDKIGEDWLKKLVKYRANFKYLSFSELLAILELLNSVQMPMEEWKNIVVNLFSMPLRDTLICTSDTQTSIMNLITKIDELLQRSFSTTYAAHKASNLVENYNVNELLSDLRQQFFVNCINSFIVEIKGLENEAVRSIVRYNGVLQNGCLEDIMRRAIMASPNKLKAMESQLTACRIIDDLLFFLFDKEKEIASIRTRLKLLGDSVPVAIKAGVEFLEQVRDLHHRFFLDIALKQFLRSETLSFSEFRRVVQHLEKYSYTLEHWMDWISILDIPIQEDVGTMNVVDIINAIDEPLDGFIECFKKVHAGRQEIEADVINIKDKYYLNVIMNLEREYVELKHARLNLNEFKRRNAHLQVAFNYCYDKLVYEKERAEEFIVKNCGKSILLE